MVNVRLFEYLTIADCISFKPADVLNPTLILTLSDRRNPNVIDGLSPATHARRAPPSPCTGPWICPIHRAKRLAIRQCDLPTWQAVSGSRSVFQLSVPPAAVVRAPLIPTAARSLCTLARRSDSWSNRVDHDHPYLLLREKAVLDRSSEQLRQRYRQMAAIIFP
jgi:hypothetical protein